MKFGWQNLPRPFFALAPMEGATDTVFRQIVMSCGKPDVAFTEFTNCDGLLSRGKDEVTQRLKFEKSEHPLIAQIWGTNPNSFYEVAKIVMKMGFDGIDINMGCPEKTVIKHGACSALIQNPTLAAEIIEQTRKGAGGLPVSVKTRIGFKTIQTEEWIGFLLKQNLDALTIHLRTQKEMSNVPPHLEEAEKISNLKNKISKKTVLILNGDIMNKKQGSELAKQYDFDGVMIGRGVFHNPYVFDENIKYDEVSKQKRFQLLKKHLDLFEKTWDGKKKYAPLKRFFKIYIQSFDGAAEIREKLMETKSLEEAKETLKDLKQ